MPTVKAEVAGKVLTLLGYDGSDFYNVLVDVNGRLQIDVVGSGLPLGAATEATLATLATEAKLELVRLLLVSIDGVDFATGVDVATVVTELALKADLTETQPVSVAVLPLPAGATTEARQTTLHLELQQKLETADLNIEAVTKDLQVDVKASGLPTGASTEATLATLATEAKLELVRLLLVSIDGVDFATGVDVATVVTELALKADLTETQPVSAASLPLPTGAATSAHQTTLEGKIDALPDLIFQGEHRAGANGAANTPNNTWTDLAIYTVPANKVFYPTVWLVGIQLPNQVFEAQMSVGGAAVLTAFSANAPAAVYGVGLGKATAGQAVKASGKQVSGGAAWMNGCIHGFLIDA